MIHNFDILLPCFTGVCRKFGYTKKAIQGKTQKLPEGTPPKALPQGYSPGIPPVFPLRYYSPGHFCRYFPQALLPPPSTSPRQFPWPIALGTSPGHFSRAHTSPRRIHPLGHTIATLFFPGTLFPGLFFARDFFLGPIFPCTFFPWHVFLLALFSPRALSPDTSPGLFFSGHFFSWAFFFPSTFFPWHFFSWALFSGQYFSQALFLPGTFFPTFFFHGPF